MHFSFLIIQELANFLHFYNGLEWICRWFINYFQPIVHVLKKAQVFIMN